MDWRPDTDQDLFLEGHLFDNNDLGLLSCINSLRTKKCYVVSVNCEWTIVRFSNMGSKTRKYAE